MAYQSEAQTWQEMTETLQEVYEIQETNLPQQEYGGVGRRNVVVIRIQLAPGTRAVFGHPRNIVNAVGAGKAPFSGKTVVPVKEMDELNGEVSHGLVYAPEIGSNEFEFSFLGKNALRKAGGWLGRQLTRMPQLAQRVQRVKALIGGKPCPGCEKSFVRRIGQLVPRNVKFQFNRGANGGWNGNLNYTDGQGRDINLSGQGSGRNWGVNMQGQGANGQDFGGQFNNANGNWDGNFNYQDPRGNQVDVSGQGQAGQGFNVDGNANINGNYFDAGASYDGQNYGGHGIWSGKNGQFAGGAISGAPGQFQGQGAVRGPNFNANADVNYSREMESSVLGEVFYEMGM
jgi:hypothetical protein